MPPRTVRVLRDVDASVAPWPLRFGIGMSEPPSRRGVRSRGTAIEGLRSLLRCYPGPPHARHVRSPLPRPRRRQDPGLGRYTPLETSIRQSPLGERLHAPDRAPGAGATSAALLAATAAASPAALCLQV